MGPRWRGALGQGGSAGEPRDVAEVDGQGRFVAATPAARQEGACVARARASFGELVMQDSSPFRWFEERGPACQLIALIDDATSRVWARFVEHDTTEENLRTLGGWLQRYGCPMAHYTDKNSIFRTAGPAALGE